MSGVTFYPARSRYTHGRGETMPCLRCVCGNPDLAALGESGAPGNHAQCPACQAEFWLDASDARNLLAALGLDVWRNVLSVEAPLPPWCEASDMEMRCRAYRPDPAAPPNERTHVLRLLRIAIMARGQLVAWQ